MSNKRNTPLTTAAFYAVMLFCLAGVAAGSYLLMVPNGDTPHATETDTPVTAVTPEVDRPPAEVLNPLPLTDPEFPEEPPEELPEPEPEPEPEPMPEIPVSTPSPAVPVVAVVPTPVVSPLEGEVVSVFSMESLTYNETLDDWRTHDGIDIAAPAGTPVLAACGGVVADVRDDDLLGTTVVLQHSDGIRTTYANLESEPDVVFGEKVSSGQQIGTVGVSAAAESAMEPHLHFSVSKDGQMIDPAEYLAP